MLTTQFLKGIMSEARPIIERQREDAEIIAGLRDVFAAQGGDWSALKAVIKAQIQDEQDETGDGKRIRKVLERAGNQTAYADMLGLNMNENNFVPVEHDADGVFPDDEPQPETAAQGGTEPANPVASRPIQPETANEASGDDGRAGLDAADHGLVEAGNGAVSSNAGGSNVVATSAHIVAGEGAHNAPVTPFTPKPLRPHCLKPERCGGQGRQHCWSCTQAMNQGKVA